MSKRNNFFGSKSGLTARTIAFLAATGISDTTIANALNAMDLALIANGLDTKLYALYPFVGGTASTHKFNFMNPADTDAALRLTFFGGGTHGATGWLPNGTTGYADTHFNDQTQLINTGDFGMGYYSRTNNTTAGKADMGANTGTGRYTWIAPKLLAPDDYVGAYDNSFFFGNYLTNTQRYISIERNAGTEYLYQEDTQKASRVFAATGYTNLNFYLGARNSIGSAASFSVRELAFADIRKYLTGAEMTTYNSIINNFQTALSRNV